MTGRMMDLLESGGRPIAVAGQPGLDRHVLEGAVAPIAIKGVRPPAGDEQVGMPVVVVVPHGGRRERRSLQIHVAEHRAIMAHDRGYDRRDGSAIRGSGKPRRPGQGRIAAARPRHPEEAAVLRGSALRTSHLRMTAALEGSVVMRPRLARGRLCPLHELRKFNSCNPAPCDRERA